MARHAAPKAAPRAAAKNRAAARKAGPRHGARGPAGTTPAPSVSRRRYGPAPPPPPGAYGSGVRSPVQMARFRRPEPVVINVQEQAGKGVKAAAGAPRILIAEFLIAVVVVAAKPFEKAGHDAKFSEGTIGQFAAIMIFFFILALVGSVSAKAQKVANLFGALVTLGLIFKNTESIASVAGAINKSVKSPPADQGTPGESAGPQNEGAAPTSTGA